MTPSPRVRQDDSRCLANGPLPLDADSKTHTASARFTHSRGANAPVDEAALECWWRRFGDTSLDALIHSALQHGFDISAACLKLQAHQARFPFDHAEPVSDEPPFADGELADLYRGWQALAEFQAVKVRIAARVARSYFSILTLRERIVAVDLSMLRQRSVLASSREGDSAPGHPAVDLKAVLTDNQVLADSHAHRIRLQGELDAATVALAQLLGEPLSITANRLKSQMLPGAAAEDLHPGTPAELLQRRADVRSAYHAVQAERALAGGETTPAVRQAVLSYEQAAANALAQVECALVQLASCRNELAPVRAAALAVNAALRRVRRLPGHSKGDLSRWLQAERLRHTREDDEIGARGSTYLALVNLFEALGAGWPLASMDSAPFDPAQAP